MPEVYFIRHAESLENVQIRHFFSGLERMRRFKLPTLNELEQSIQLLRFNLDAEISPIGLEQIDDMRTVLSKGNVSMIILFLL